MAAEHAATPPSKQPNARSAAGSRGQDPNRFDELDTPRYFTDVNVEGYNVAKSVAKSKKKREQIKRAEQLGREAKQQSVSEPVTLSKRQRTRAAPEKGQQPCSESFQFEI